MPTDPAVSAEYNALEAASAIASTLIAARSAANLTQKEIASRMQTRQGAFARLERAAGGLPSMRSLARYAEPTGTKLRISFEPSRTP